MSVWLLLANALHIACIVGLWSLSSVGQAQDAADALRGEPFARWALRLLFPASCAALLIGLSSLTLGIAVLRRLDSVSLRHSIQLGRVRTLATQVVPVGLALGGAWVVALRWTFGDDHSIVQILFCLVAAAAWGVVITALCRALMKWSEHGVIMQSEVEELTRPLPHTIRAWLPIASAGLAALILIGTVKDAEVARAIGPLGTLLMGVHAWALLLTLCFVTIPLRINWLPGAVAWMVLLALVGSRSADLYRLPATIEASGTPSANPSYARDQTAFYEWLESRFAKDDSDDPIPVVLVSADGGGIRAAYWAARSLALLNLKTDGRLAHFIFAYSGVSGGSLGVATFVDAAINQRRTPKETLGAIDEFYSRDFLSPELARLVTMEPLRYFAGLSGIEGRDQVFERVLDADWHAITGSSSFSMPFLNVMGYVAKREFPPPVVILNATVAETGKRLEIANIQGSEPGPSESSR